MRRRESADYWFGTPLFILVAVASAIPMALGLTATEAVNWLCHNG